MKEKKKTPKMIVTPKLRFSRSQFCDLRGVRLRFTIEEIDGEANVIVDDTTTFDDDRFKARLLHSGCINLSDKESLQGREPLRVDFRGFNFAGYDLFDTKLDSCIFDSVTSFEGAYVCDTKVPTSIDLDAQGAIVFGQGSLSLHGQTIDADLDLSKVVSLAGSSLLGTNLEACNLLALDTRTSIRSALGTSFTHCLFDHSTRFPRKMYDEDGDEDGDQAVVADCDYNDATLRVQILSGGNVTYMKAGAVRDMELVMNEPLPAAGNLVQVDTIPPESAVTDVEVVTHDTIRLTFADAIDFVSGMRITLADSNGELPAAISGSEWSVNTTENTDIVDVTSDTETNLDSTVQPFNTLTGVKASSSGRVEVPLESRNDEDAIGWAVGFSHIQPSTLTIGSSQNSVTLRRRDFNFISDKSASEIIIYSIEGYNEITLPLRLTGSDDEVTIPVGTSMTNIYFRAEADLSYDYVGRLIVQSATSDTRSLTLFKQSATTEVSERHLQCLIGDTTPTFVSQSGGFAFVESSIVTQTVGDGADLTLTGGHTLSVRATGGVVGVDAAVYNRADANAVADATHKVRIAAYDKLNHGSRMVVDVDSSVNHVLVGSDIAELLHYLKPPADLTAGGVARAGYQTEVTVAGASEYDVVCVYTQVGTGTEAIAGAVRIACSRDAPLPTEETAESLGMIRPRLDSLGPPTNMQAQRFDGVAWQGTFEYANFRACEFLGCDLRRCTFRYCDFSGASFAGCRFGNFVGAETGDTFECCLINGETQVGSCTLTTFHSTRTTELVEATEKIIDVADSTLIPESGMLRIGRERMQYTRESPTSVRATLRGIGGTYVKAHASNELVTVEIESDATFKTAFFDTTNPSVDLHDIPLSYSGTIQGVIPLLHRKKKTKAVRTLVARKMEDADGDYVEYSMHMASQNGDLYSGDCELYVTYGGRTVRVSNLIRVTKDGRASELTRFIGTCYDPSIVALYTDTTPVRFSSDTADADYDATLSAEVDAEISIANSTAFDVFVRDSTVVNTEFGVEGGLRKIVVAIDEESRFRKCDFAGEILVHMEDLTPTRLGSLVIDDCNVADATFLSNDPSERDTFPATVKLQKTGGSDEVLTRRLAGSLESEFSIRGTTVANGNNRQFSVLPDIAGKTEAQLAYLRSKLPIMFALDNADYPFELATLQIDGTYSVDSQHLPRVAAVYIDSYRSGTGNPRVELFSFDDPGTPTVGGVDMTRMSDPLSDPIHHWGIDVALSSSHTVVVNGVNVVAKPYRPAPSIVMEMDPDVAADYYANVVTSVNESAVISQGDARAYLVAGEASSIVPPTILIEGLGSGAEATPVMVGGGAIASISVDNAGSGYLHARVDIDGVGSGAEYTAVVVGGQVTGYTKVSEGSGYVGATVNTDRFVGGSGATFTPVLSNGAITGITVDNGGDGYRLPSYWTTRRGTPCRLSVTARAPRLASSRSRARCTLRLL